MFMKRITLVLGVVAVMAAMLVALAAPAMAEDNGGNHNNGGGHNNGITHIENQLDRLDNGLDNHNIFRSDNDFSFTSFSPFVSHDFDDFGFNTWPFWDDTGVIVNQ